jgi:hypothetical protein
VRGFGNTPSRFLKTVRHVSLTVNGFCGCGTNKKKARSKGPHVNATCGRPKFVLGFIVRATRPPPITLILISSAEGPPGWSPSMLQYRYLQ